MSTSEQSAADSLASSNAEMANRAIGIIGGGFAGLTLARCLAKKGIKAIIYEKSKSEQPPRRSYGVTLHATTYQPLLEILGMDETSFRQRVAVDTDHQGNGSINPRLLGYYPDLTSASIHVNRSRLETLLREGITTKWDTFVDDLSNSSHPPDLLLKDRKSVGGHVAIVAADGVHSRARQWLSTQSPQLDTSLDILPYVAINGKRRIPLETYQTVFAPHMQDSTIVEVQLPITPTSTSPGEKAATTTTAVLHISINDISPSNSEASISYTYSRPAITLTSAISPATSSPSAKDLESSFPHDPLFTPARPKEEATKIPPAFHSELTSLAPQIRALPPQFAETFTPAKMRDDRMLSWLMRSGRLETAADSSSSATDVLTDMAIKGVFFIGDALHAEPILGGNGANAAIADAVALADLMGRVYGEEGCNAESAEGKRMVREWVQRRLEGWKEGDRKARDGIARMHMPAQKSERAGL